MTGRRRGGGGGGGGGAEKSWGEIDTKASQTKGNAKGKGKGKTGKGDAPWTSTISGAKTVQELEAEMLIMKLQRGGGGAEDAGAPKREAVSLAKQPLEAKGNHCEVKKHSGMGCAVVSMESKRAREGVMMLALQRSPANEVQPGEERRPVLNIDGVSVQMRNHHDKGSDRDIETDIFLAWGRQAEKQAPLSAVSLAKALDQLWFDACQGFVPMMQQVPAFGAAVSGQLAPSPMAVPPPLPPTPPMPGQPVQAAPGQAMYNYSGMSMGVPQHTPEVMYNVPVHQAQSYPGYYPTNDVHVNYDYNSYAQAQPPATPERRSFRIVDPKTQQAIEGVPQRPHVPSDQMSPEKVHKPLKIVDPTSGDQIDVMNFTPAKSQSKAFSIIDPYSGTAIKV